MTPETRPEPTVQDLLEEIEALYDALGRDADHLPGEIRWTSDWRGSPLQMMPLAARGLYSEMLTQAWAGRARLNITDEDEIMRLVRSIPEEWAIAWPKVRHYWKEATDPRTGERVFVNRKQLRVYLGSLRSRSATLIRNRKAAIESVKARKARAAVQEPRTETPRRTAPAAPAPPPPSKAMPKPSVREVPPCPECGGELKRQQRSSSPGGQRYPPSWWCATQKAPFVLNDPRIYDRLTSAARESIDHELDDYERATASSTGAEAPAQRAARTLKAVPPPPPPGPSALKKASPF